MQKWFHLPYIEAGLIDEENEGDCIISGLQTGNDGFGYIVCDIEPENLTEVREIARSIGNRLMEFHHTRKLLEAERYAGLGKFLHGFAHHINTPLGNTITSLSLVENQIISLDREEELIRHNAWQILKEANLAASRNLEIIRQLVELFRRLSTVSEYHFWDFGFPEELLVSFLDMEKMNAELRNVKIAVEYETGDHPIYFPTESFRFILHELVENSLKYGFPEGHPEDSVISIRFSLQNKKMNVSYYDNGRGIPFTRQKGVFAPFNHMGKIADGLGLGLFAVKRIIQDFLSGNVELSDTEKRGFHINLKFPIPAAQPRDQ